MEHRFITAAETEGVWSMRDRSEYCHWWWDEGSRTLRVDHRGRTRELTVPGVEHRVECGIRLDLPETAKDLARLIERTG